MRIYFATGNPGQSGSRIDESDALPHMSALLSGTAMNLINVNGLAPILA